MITFSEQSVIGTFTSKMTHGLLAARLWARARALQFDRHLIAKFTHSLATKIESNSSSSVLKLPPALSLSIRSKPFIAIRPSQILSVYINYPHQHLNGAAKGRNMAPMWNLAQRLKLRNHHCFLQNWCLRTKHSHPILHEAWNNYIEYGVPAPSILHSRLITSSSS